MFSACADERPTFSTWIEGIKEEAANRGIGPATTALLDAITPDTRVIGFDRHQPEFVQTFDEYLELRVTPDRVLTARQKYRENLKVLTEIGDHYGVDPQYIVAFWGLESSFGRHQGSYSVLRSLATLAYDPRRSAFFTSELFSALKVLDEGHISPDKFVGGWAGAMGQNQFLPSSFLHYAQDYNGDGRKNIWSEPVDVWASIANFLRKNKWRKGAGWGAKVILNSPIDYDVLRPEKISSGCRALRHHTKRLPISKWRSMGVVGELNLLGAASYALLIPEAGNESSWLVGGNFRSILSYNCANKYAVSIGLMADRIIATTKP